MIDLSLVSTHDLLKELKGRFDYLVFSAVRELGPATGMQEHEECWKGHSVICAGIAAGVIRNIQDWERTSDEDDDAKT